MLYWKIVYNKIAYRKMHFRANNAVGAINARTKTQCTVYTSEIFDLYAHICAIRMRSCYCFIIVYEICNGTVSHGSAIDTQTISSLLYIKPISILFNMTTIIFHHRYWPTYQSSDNPLKTAVWITRSRRVRKSRP